MVSIKIEAVAFLPWWRLLPRTLPPLVSSLRQERIQAWGLITSLGCLFQNEDRMSYYTGTPDRNPSPLPCSRSDIRLAAAVASGAGGLLHHLCTHHPDVPTPSGHRDWSVLCCSCRHRQAVPGLAFSPSDLPPMKAEVGVGKFLPISTPSRWGDGPLAGPGLLKYQIYSIPKPSSLSRLQGQLSLCPKIVRNRTD